MGHFISSESALSNDGVSIFKSDLYHRAHVVRILNLNSTHKINFTLLAKYLQLQIIQKLKFDKHPTHFFSGGVSTQLQSQIKNPMEWWSVSNYNFCSSCECEISGGLGLIFE